jgi:hypothetical protein
MTVGGIVVLGLVGFYVFEVWCYLTGRRSLGLDGRPILSVGTKSLLFGVHQVFVHPFFVAAAWWKLYGFPWDPRLWVAFAVHDWGYWGKPNMDGPEGERHPELGARIMGRLFDPKIRLRGGYSIASGHEWRDFTLYHSRFYAKRVGQPPSQLCFADKLAVSMTPWWLYLPLARMSGELAEYKAGGAGRFDGSDLTDREFLRGIQDHTRRWVDEHRDGCPDACTPTLEGKSK